LFETPKKQTPAHKERGDDYREVGAGDGTAAIPLGINAKLISARILLIPGLRPNFRIGSFEEEGNVFYFSEHSSKKASINILILNNALKMILRKIH
jgi:hypothetical protein